MWGQKFLRNLTQFPAAKIRHRQALSKGRKKQSISRQENAPPTKPYKEVPQPKRLPLLGTSLDYSSFKRFDASALGEHWINRHKELGPVFKETILPGITDTIIFCSSHSDTEKMFRNEGCSPYRDPLAPLLVSRNMMGQHCGLVNSNGAEWKRIRGIVNRHILNNKSVWQLTGIQQVVMEDFMKYIERNLNENNEVPDFHKALNRWAFEMTGIFTMGIRLGALDDNLNIMMKQMIDCNEIMFDCMGRLLYGLPTWKYFNTKDFKKLYSAHYGQVESAKQHMQMFRNKTNENKHFESLSKIFHDNGLSESEKIIMMTEFLIAGIDTTSNSMAFILYALATNPEAQEKVRKEILDFKKSNQINGKSLHKLKYLHAAIKETQRMYPFVSSMSRRYSKDIVLSGYVIPAGTQILNTSNMVNSRNPEYFNNPNNFEPERWMDIVSTEEKQLKRFAMTGPFGMGPRMCPGRKFAMQELQIGIISILSKYKVEYHHKPIRVSFKLVSYPSQKPQFKFVPLES